MYTYIPLRRYNTYSASKLFCGMGSISLVYVYTISPCTSLARERDGKSCGQETRDESEKEG